MACNKPQESDEHQLNILMHCLREDTQDVLASINASEEGSKKYD